MVVPVDRIWLTIWLRCELFAAWLLACAVFGYRI